MAVDVKLVKSEGKVEFDKDMRMVLNLLPNGKYKLKIIPYKEARTLDQNSTMWMWFRCLGAAMREYTGDERWSTKEGVDAIHDMYCSKFLTKHVVDPKGRSMTIVRKTSKLSKKEMSSFLDAVKTDIMVEFGIQLPLPEDKYYAEFAAQYDDKY